MRAVAEQLFFEGNRHLAARDHARAEACFRQALAIEPTLAEAHANLAWLLEHAGLDDEAAGRYRHALALSPRCVQTHLNFGTLLARTGQWADAEGTYRRAIALDPASAPAWSNLGALQAQMARFADAEASFRRSLEADPGYANAHVNLAYLCLRAGRYEQGWQHYEHRPWQTSLAAQVDGARWAGESLAGKSLLVAHEGGHGDLIHFGRYVDLLKRGGARRIALVCPPALRALMATLDGIDETFSLDEPPPRTGWDYWTSLLSIACHCRTRVDSIPAQLPYLHAQPEAVQRWRAMLPTGVLRVGLAWKGNPRFENDAARSLPSLDLLEPLAGVDGVAFVSLQKGAGEDEVQRPGRVLKVLPLASSLTSFAETAAVIQNLDLVISVDTAVAHLAGALGRPCWLLLPHRMADWRWLADREDSPWYPGVVRLFRQQAADDWEGVVGRVRRALDQMTCTARAMPAH